MCAVLTVAMHLILTQPLDLRQKIDPEKGEYLARGMSIYRLASDSRDIVDDEEGACSTIASSSYGSAASLLTLRTSAADMKILTKMFGACIEANSHLFVRYLCPDTEYTHSIKHATHRYTDKWQVEQVPMDRQTFKRIHPFIKMLELRLKR